ncbi:MAG: putative oxidoreductase C-terminal domain-containing protein [Planctomycetota bacterium]|jgi:predicted dehydrogenase
MSRRVLLTALLLTVVLGLPLAARGEKEVFRLGMIGLDTSHVIAFTQIINNPENNYGCKVVAGYPGGSDDVYDSYTRIEKFTKQIHDELGVEIVDSIEELCRKVDGVLLESVDGRPHLEQVRPVIAAGKPVFIDKPMAGSLEDVIEIFRLAKENNVPCWTSSSARFSPDTIGMRNNKEVGEVLGCATYGPCKLEEHHPDFYWYGIHGIESLFTIMGTGCERVWRVHTDDTDLAIGIWEDGRIGTFRGLRSGKIEYGATVFGSKSIFRSGRGGGYKPLIDEVIKFFKTGRAPVPAEETIEIFAFMSAADESKAQDGAAVSIKSVIEKAKSKNKECGKKKTSEMTFTGAKGEVKLMTLDPGHFHAALVQKTMYEQVSPTVHVYAPKGSDVEDHLNRIRGFNERAENPTNWKEIVYTGDDFLEKMLEERPGNVVMISGNNKKKAQYIKACVDAGLNVLSDKPMCIDAEGFKLIEEAFESAEKNGVLLYDVMTERSEITTILQKALVHNKAVFGQLQKGTVDEPAVVKESIHHFFKYVSGNVLKRPGWYFDTTQQGEAIVDVTTHLLDMIMWGCFPGETIDYEKDIDIKQARRWPTMISRQQYKKVTRLDDFPGFLKKELNEDGILPCYANGEIIYTLKGIHAKASVMWKYQAPEGTKDTHFSVMKGSKSHVIIRQGKEQNYRPELYVEPTAGANKKQLARALKNAVAALQGPWPGVRIEQMGDIWHIVIPDKYRIGHEAHFGQVTERYMKFLVEGKMPRWEVPNMKAKYQTTTSALALAREKSCCAKPKVEFIKGKDKIDVVVGNKYFTSYRYGGKAYKKIGDNTHDYGFLAKPVLHPVYSPSGIMVNRSYPLGKIKGESNDHPHHVGIFFTYGSEGEINGDDFWGQTGASSSQIKHVKVTEMTGGAGKGKLSTVMNWTGENGNVLLEENRDMIFYAGENEYVIDFNIDLTAQDNKVVFRDTKEGMLGIRVAPFLRETAGSNWVKGVTGTAEYLSSNGERQEKNIWGKRARWVRLQGKKDDKTVGFVIFNHPTSVNYPPYWHARGYGLFAANPLGQFAFQKGRKIENPQPFNFTLEPGQTAHFEFRMVIYEGDRTKEQLERQFEDFAK